MKLVAVLLLIAAVAYARPGGGKGGDNGSPMDGMDDGDKLFLDLIGLCKKLAEAADDKRSWDAVLELFGGVCEKVEAAIEAELGDVSDLDRRGRRKSADWDKPSPTGDPRPMKSEKSDDDSYDDRSGPAPTGDPRPKKSRKGDKSDKGSFDERSGPTPTGDPRSQKGDKSDKGSYDERRGPAPTGDPRPRKGDKSGKGSFEDKSGPAPTGDPRPKKQRKGDKSDKGSYDERSGPAPTGDPKSKEDGPAAAKELLRICDALAKMALEKDVADKRAADAITEALKGMEEVCLAAFLEVKGSK